MKQKTITQENINSLLFEMVESIPPEIKEEELVILINSKTFEMFKNANGDVKEFENIEVIDTGFFITQQPNDTAVITTKENYKSSIILDALRD